MSNLHLFLQAWVNGLLECARPTGAVDSRQFAEVVNRTRDELVYLLRTLGVDPKPVLAFCLNPHADYVPAAVCAIQEAQAMLSGLPIGTALKTVWFHGGRSYSTNGCAPVSVPAELHNVLKLFLDGDEARTTKELGKDVSNPTRVIDKIVKKFGAAIVRRPVKGQKGDGYFIDVRSLEK
jgi:hypothetical protein